MPDYCVNKNAQDDGYHEVHDLTCNNLPDAENRKPLGSFSTCHGAVTEAKKTYPKSDGCRHCSPACHTR